MSLYAQYLLLNLVDYEVASTRDKERIDLLVTSNSTGKQGCCIPLDMACEHYVRRVKDLFRSFNNQLTPTLICKAILSQNTTVIMADHWNNSLGKGHSNPGGEHRHDMMDDSEKNLIAEEF